MVVRKTLRRRQTKPFFSKLEPCLIGMEACGTVARLLDEEPEFRVRDVMTLPFRDVGLGPIPGRATLGRCPLLAKVSMSLEAGRLCSSRVTPELRKPL